MMTLLDTEQSYVESLRTLIQVTQLHMLSGISAHVKDKHTFVGLQTADNMNYKCR